MELLNFFKDCFVAVFSGDFIFYFLGILIVFSCFLFFAHLCGKRR